MSGDKAGTIIFFHYFSPLMNLSLQTPKKSLNKAYLKEKVSRTDIELFKGNLHVLLNKINEKESEEHLKNVVSDFLKDTWYKKNHEINTKDRKDLVIHTGKSSKDPVGVILEVKRTQNKSEMISVDKPNNKAMHELILYYLNERIENSNLNIKHLVITNIYEWFIFDVNEFDKKVYRNSAIRKLYETKNTDKKDNPFFYEELSKYLSDFPDTINCSYFDIRKYQNVLSNDNKQDDNKLIELYKILSPIHLLKQPFANDSNSLDTDFYEELLYIIGLEEVKDKKSNKRLIKRKTKSSAASLIENTIIKLEDKDCLRNIQNAAAFGISKQDQLFNIALELCITWVNRILFLKLLEGQLATYHKGDKDYLFLNSNIIFDFDELSNLFFQVLAEKHLNRRSHIKEKFIRVPYLNSSLFERTDLERQCFDISALDNRLELTIYEKSVIKRSINRNKTNELPVLQYLFEFLDSYDFSSVGSEDIQEDNKNLINASVLGLIFEKINGYKDGSFFTPGFVTMYMCKESIRRTVIRKFNEVKGWDCQDMESLHNKIEDKEDANNIINSLKVCDPAVGSGHFLVSALNEIIAIKSELRILMDKNGKTLRDYHIEVINDELIIYDEDGKLFDYNPNNIESQRVQETLFHEKEVLIENCLFGVDINPNSVKICRLRLWIELLKNAYYKNGLSRQSQVKELETLPNIDINIKCGNSLISRFALDADLSKTLKNKDYTIEKYRKSVADYRITRDREIKKSLEEVISGIKNDFKTSIWEYDPKKIRLKNLSKTFFDEFKSSKLDLEMTAKEKKAKDLRRKKLETEINKLNNFIDGINGNKIYENAFEWRFEFPEVLNDAGEFIGFDLIIGNPPYGVLLHENSKSYIQENYKSVQGPFEVYKFFVEKGINLLRPKGFLCYISPDTWLNLSYFKNLREIIIGENELVLCTESLYKVFEEATVDTNIYLIQKGGSKIYNFTIINSDLIEVGEGTIKRNDDDISISLKVKSPLIEEIEKDTQPLDNFVEAWRGMSAYGAKNPDRPYNSYSKDTDFHRPMLNGGDIGKYSIKWNGEYIKYGEWLHRPRPSFIYDQPHILVQRIRNPRLKDRIVAAYDEDKYISSDGLSNLILRDEMNGDYLKYILAILNSKLINHWFSFYFFDVNIKPEQLRRIPIKKQVSDDILKAFVKIVDYLILINKQESQVDEYVPNSHIANQFEEIIDAMVFEVYFKDEFQRSGIEIIQYLDKYFVSLNKLQTEERLLRIHEAYQSIRLKENEIRNNILLMKIELRDLLMPIISN